MFKIRLSEALKIIEAQDLTDIVDRALREYNKLEAENKDLKERNDELILLLDIERRK